MENTKDMEFEKRQIENKRRNLQYNSRFMLIFMGAFIGSIVGFSSFRFLTCHPLDGIYIKVECPISKHSTTSYHRRTPFTDFSSYSLKYYFLIIPELFGSSANFSKLQKTTLNMRIYTGLHRLVHVQILYFAEEP